jgi:uncharacterized membrane protein
MTPQELIAHGLTPELAVFITSMLPIVELRGALPLAINVYHIPWIRAFFIAYFGNLIPVPFILWLLKPLVILISRIKPVGKIFAWLFERTRKRSSAMIERYEEIGLLVFVAIPLPGTGAWTGALIAFLFGLDFKKSCLVIALGVFIAGVIVTCLCLLGWIGAVIAGVGFIALFSLGLWKL